VEIKPHHFAACIRISPEQPYIEKVAAKEMGDREQFPLR
jgi:hypothetical protein